MRSRIRLMSLALCCVGSLAAFVPARAGEGQDQVARVPHVMVELRGGLLSVTLRNAPWVLVLEEIERRTGIVIEMKGVPRGTLTDEFEDRPLDEALRGLFRDVGLVFLYQTKETGQGTSAPALHRVWLFPRADASAAGPAHHPPGGAASVKPRWDPGLDREARLQRLDVLAMTEDSEALDAALVDPDRDVQTKALEVLLAREGAQALDRVVALSGSDDSAVQLQALVLLSESGYVDEATVLSAVGAAVGDKDRDVKEYAIQALAGRSGSQAMEYLKQAASDPDPNVRMRVLENVAQYGEGTALLRQALSDGDEGVRTLAGFLLKQVTEAR
jgi:hypothetical protein